MVNDFRCWPINLRTFLKTQLENHKLHISDILDILASYSWYTCFFEAVPAKWVANRLDLQIHIKCYFTLHIDHSRGTFIDRLCICYISSYLLSYKMGTAQCQNVKLPLLFYMVGTQNLNPVNCIRVAWKRLWCAL